MTLIKKAVFPVAGLGTRFLPATKAQPKEMLPLIDKPIIQYVIEEAIESGIKELIMITGRGKRAIEDHFDYSFELEHNLAARGKLDLLAKVEETSRLADFAYIRQKEPLGLGHAVLMAKNLVNNNEAVAVFLPDEIVLSKTPLIKQMMDVYQRLQSSIISIGEVSRDEVSRYGIVKIDPTPLDKEGRVFEITDLVEKPKTHLAPSSLAILGGRYILTNRIFEALEKTSPGASGEIQLTDGIKKLLQQEKVYAYQFSGERYDLGEVLGFLKATVNLALKRKDIQKEFKKFLKTLKL